MKELFLSIDSWGDLFTLSIALYVLTVFMVTPIFLALLSIYKTTLFFLSIPDLLLTLKERMRNLGKISKQKETNKDGL